MDKEALTTEISGQTLKLLELYTKKDGILTAMKEEEKQLAVLEQQIKELGGIIQTLNFVLQTDGFTNLPADAKKQPVSTPGRAVPNAPNKVTLGEGDVERS